MKRLSSVFASVAILAGAALAASTHSEPLPPQTQNWSFNGVFGTYDKGAVQRGFQVYKEVCSACHSLNMVAFHDLSGKGGPGFSEAQARVIASGYNLPAEPNERGETLDDKGNRITRPGVLADHFPPPFPNEQAARAANGGALPPDLSLMAKARQGGPDYIYSLMLGFGQPVPHGFTVQEGKYYNPYFPGRNISMPPPLHPGQVRFADGTPPTVEAQAKAVATFLAWASEPQLEARHETGFKVIAFLVLFAGLLFLSYRRIWHGKPEDEGSAHDLPGTGPEKS
ncbi:cytochrome c1 [Rhizomicrobium palustre]|uniref:Cytochrome c1 n=1 Tax=Rhizomicrobium palustre TaxID=189966 RepID=A0A846MWJ1_9PROT|nr:cytochrome c1 [Rhizomicrobium palustre]NIK87766.1 cytochrome c1 [Rhizomicrobium palustre]